MAGSQGGERLRTPTSVLRWLLDVGSPLAVVVAILASVLTGPARAIALGLLATGTGVLLVRIGRIEARVDAGGVRVRNPFRTVEMRWDEVARADWIARSGIGQGLRPWGSDLRVRLTLRDGGMVTLTSTTVFRRRAAEDVTDALRRTAGRAGVVVEPAYREGPPPRR